LNRFVSVSNELCVLFAIFGTFDLDRIPGFLLLIIVKILSIEEVFDSRYVWRFFLSQFWPINPHEKGM